MRQRRLRIGVDRITTVDERIIAATNCNLKELAEKKNVTGYRLKKILENLRSPGVISLSRGPEGIHLEKSGHNLIKTHKIS